MRGSSKHRDRRKRLQLGLPIGTASARLRKRMLFLLVQETGRDNCFRCGTKIEEAEDLTFDHKLPWIDVSVELFWDLGNVAFSHALCNSISRRTTAGRVFGPSVLRKVAPPGMAWCTRHACFVPASEFNRNRAKWSGLQSFCRTCASKTPTLEVAHSEALILARLAEQGPLRMGELYEALGFRKLTVVNAVRRLVGLGLLHRRKITDDLRIWCVGLTASGKRLANALSQGLAEIAPNSERFDERPSCVSYVERERCGAT